MEPITRADLPEDVNFLPKLSDSETPDTSADYVLDHAVIAPDYQHATLEFIVTVLDVDRPRWVFPRTIAQYRYRGFGEWLFVGFSEDTLQEVRTPQWDAIHDEREQLLAFKVLQARYTPELWAAGHAALTEARNDRIVAELDELQARVTELDNLLKG